MTPTETERSDWAQAFAEECPSALEKALNLTLTETLFIIYRSEATDHPRWAIVPSSDRSFWMAAFDTQREARMLCQRMGWGYVCE